MVAGQFVYMFILLNNITIPLNNIGVWGNLSTKLIASHCMQQDEYQGIIANLKHSTNTVIYACNAHIDIAIQATLVVCNCSQH